VNYREHSAGVPKVKAFMTWMMRHINHPSICRSELAREPLNDQKIASKLVLTGEGVGEAVVIGSFVGVLFAITLCASAKAE